MIRTSGKAVSVEAFDGCNQLIDEVKLPPEFTRWGNGGFFTERHEFERITGKITVGTSTAFGCLLGLKQVEFKDKMVVIVHSSGMYSYEGSDMSGLRTSQLSIGSTVLNSFMTP